MASRKEESPKTNSNGHDDKSERTKVVPDNQNNGIPERKFSGIPDKQSNAISGNNAGAIPDKKANADTQAKASLDVDNMNWDSASNKGGDQPKENNSQW
jgi:hypothetical protein